ncbi:MAG: hypothetical protein H0W50_02245, partial [Parachlamydiaceae bacterium]|nr:hypothetical protein [Parachlamydiaceae bacterium]
MESNNYNFNISTFGKTYEFNLLAKNKDLTSGFTVMNLDESDKQFIQQLLQNTIEKIEGFPSIEALANKLRLQPIVLHIDMTPSSKIHKFAVSTILKNEAVPVFVHKPIAEIAKSINEDLKATCLEGAGSIIMVSRPGDGTALASAGTCSVNGSSLN